MSSSFIAIKSNQDGTLQTLKVLLCNTKTSPPTYDVLLIRHAPLIEHLKQGKPLNTFDDFMTHIYMRSTTYELIPLALVDPTVGEIFDKIHKACAQHFQS